MAPFFCIRTLASPFKIIMGPSVQPPPPSAMDAIRVRLFLYHESGMKEYIQEIAGILKYVKMYETITRDMGKKEKQRTISRPKWASDVESFCLYDFCSGAEEITLTESETVLAKIKEDLGEAYNPILYPHLTAPHIKTLKHALIVSDTFLALENHSTFIVQGTYYLGTNDEHPDYRHISQVSAISLPSVVVSQPTSALTSIKENTRLETSSSASIQRPKTSSSASNSTNSSNNSKKSFKTVTHTQLAIREAVLAKRHAITKSEDWMKAGLLAQCYMAQALGIRAAMRARKTKFASDDDVLILLVDDLMVEMSFASGGGILSGILEQIQGDGQKTMATDGEEIDGYQSEQEMSMVREEIVVPRVTLNSDDESDEEFPMRG